jgi:hypothetical protein
VQRKKKYSFAQFDSCQIVQREKNCPRRYKRTFLAKLYYSFAQFDSCQIVQREKNCPRRYKRARLQPSLFCSALHQPSAPDPHRDTGRADLLDRTGLVSHLSGRRVSAPLRLSRAGPARQAGRARLAGGRPGRMAGRRRRRLAESDRRVLARAGPSIRS